MASQTVWRASDKGFLPMTLDEYLKEGRADVGLFDMDQRRGWRRQWQRTEIVLTVLQ